MTRIWIDIINPSHPLFFRPVIGALNKENEIDITLRDRGETVKLAKEFAIGGRLIGEDFEGPVRKTLSIFTRTLALNFKVRKFDLALSFENPMSVAVSRMRMKRSILMLDNDLKYRIKGNFIQSIESRLKETATYFLVPEACESTFLTRIPRKKLITYNGYKEDVYIGAYEPDKKFPKKLPFEDYYVIRPEALASFYVKGSGSLVPELLKRFEKEGEKVVLLPRDRSDSNFKGGSNVHIPKDALNGLDLINYSKGVLTGSGTMAREAAVMGIPAVSFFPNETLLSVDQDLIEKGRMIHSRDVDDIMGHLGSGSKVHKKRDSRKVKDKVMAKLRELIGGIDG